MKPQPVPTFSLRWVCKKRPCSLKRWSMAEKTVKIPKCKRLLSLCSWGMDQTSEDTRAPTWADWVRFSINLNSIQIKERTTSM